MAHLRVKGENVVCLPRVHQSPSKQHGPRFVFLSLSPSNHQIPYPPYTLWRIQMTMADESETRRLRKEISTLQSYIEEQRERYAKEVGSLRKDLEEETKYSSKLRTELEEEYRHCKKLRRVEDDNSRRIQDLTKDLEYERGRITKLEDKLEKRRNQVTKLEWELRDLQDDYTEAYLQLKQTNSVRKDLADTGMLYPTTLQPLLNLHFEKKHVIDMKNTGSNS